MKLVKLHQCTNGEGCGELELDRPIVQLFCKFTSTHKTGTTDKVEPAGLSSPSYMPDFFGEVSPLVHWCNFANAPMVNVHQKSPKKSGIHDDIITRMKDFKFFLGHDFLSHKSEQNLLVTGTHYS